MRGGGGSGGGGIDEVRGGGDDQREPFQVSADRSFISYLNLVLFYFRVDETILKCYLSTDIYSISLFYSSSIFEFNDAFEPWNMEWKHNVLIR